MKLINKFKDDIRISDKLIMHDKRTVQEEISILQDENERLKGITNVLPKVSGEGTSVTLENTANAPMNFILKGNTSQKQYSGKNLFPLDQIKNKINSDTEFLKLNDNDEIIINGNSSSYSFPLNATLKAGTYTFSSRKVSGEHNGNVQAIRLTFSDNSTIGMEYTNNIVDLKKTFDTDVTLTKFELWTSNAKLTNYTIQLQIEKGSSMTDFEPYVGGVASPNPDYPQEIQVVTGNNTLTIANADNTETKEFPINLGDIELCKVNNYQDYIYKQNNKWYKHKVLKKLKLTADKPWEIYNGIIFYQMKSNYINTSKAYCNLFHNIQISSTLSNTNNINVYDYDVNNNATITLDDFKQILQNNEVYIYVILKNPIDEEITDTTLIEQLNNLYNAYSYSGTTNITQTNADLPFIIKAEALKQIN